MANINHISGSSKIKDTYTTIYNNDNSINTQLLSEITRLDNHVQGLAEKHNAEDINYTGEVIADNVKDALDATDTRVDNIIASSGTSSTEVVDARTSTAKGITYTVVKDRFEAIENDLQVPDPTPVTITESIASLPVGTVDGGTSNNKYEGLSLVNSVENGDFSDGTNGWYSLAGSSLAVTDGIMEIIGDGANNIPEIRQDTSLVVSNGDKIHFSFKARITNSNTPNIVLITNIGGSSIYNVLRVDDALENQWYTINGIFTATGYSGELVIRLIHTYQDATIANGKVMEIDGNFGVFAINLTALGLDTRLDNLGYTTDAEKESFMLDLVRQGYFEGLTNIENLKLKSVGKNLFDNNDIESGTISSDGTNSVLSTYSRTKSFISIKPSTQYYITSVERYDVYYDANFNFIARVYKPSSENILSTPSDARYLKIVFVNRKPDNNYFTVAQLEEGTTATTYEPYKSSQQSFETTLRSLPNGVKDRIYESDGEVWLTKRVSDEFLFDGDEGWADYGNGFGINSDLSRARLYNFAPDNNIVNSNSNSITGFSIGYDGLETYLGEASINNLVGKGLITVTELFIAIPTSELPSDDLTGFTTYLSNNPVTAIFQLATPELINLTEQGLVEGKLMSFSEGTVHNTSDTFGSPNITFDVPINQASVLANVVEDTQANAKELESKADKVQEDWIEPTLLNGWLNRGGTEEIVGYIKDDFGFVHIKGTIDSGIDTAGTTIFQLPIGYRPRKILSIPITSNSAFGDIKITETGLLIINIGSNVILSLNGISFRAER